MGNGFGMMAFASLLGDSLYAAGARDTSDGLQVSKLDHPARAKRVIFLFMNGGLSLAAWLPYGLGSENQTLPGFVVLCPEVPTRVGPPLWNSAFLPAVHQGTFIADKVEKETDIVGKDFDPKKLISFIHNDKFTRPEQRRELDLLEQLD